MILNAIKACEIESQSFIPEKIVERKLERKAFEEWSKAPYKDNLLLISHESGTGKTSTVKYFFKNHLAEYRKIYILCRDTITNHKTMRAIAEQLELMTGIKMGRKKDHYDLVSYIKKVLSTGEKIIICLDEIDYIIDNEGNDDLLNSLLHIKEQKPAGDLVFILISNDFFIRKKFSPITISRLGHTIIPFNGYKAGESAEILKFYIKDFGLIEKEFLPQYDGELMHILLLFVRKVNLGDMRRTLKCFIMWASKCDYSLDLNKINDNEFFDEILKNEMGEMLKNLNQDEITILLSLIKSDIDLKDADDVSFSGKRPPKTSTYNGFERFYKYYKFICGLQKIAPLAERRFRFYLKELMDKKHLIYITRISYGKSRGMRGRYELEDTVRQFKPDVIKFLCQETGINQNTLYSLNNYFM